MEFYDEEENVAHLQFGDEFFATKIDSLTNEEVYCLLKQNDGPNKVNTEASNDTLSYLQKMMIESAKDATVAKNLAVEIRKQLQGLELRKRGLGEIRAPLHHLEISSLSNLIGDDDCEIEQIHSWIPSLSRFEDDDVMTAVSIVREAKSRV